MSSAADPAGSDASLTQMAIEHLGTSLALELDRAIAKQITARLGDGWSSDDLTGRLERFIQRGHPDRYCLDGKPLLDVHDTRLTRNGNCISVTRDLALHDQAPWRVAPAG